MPPGPIAGNTAGLASGQAIKGFSSSGAIELTHAAAARGLVRVSTAGVVTIAAGGYSGVKFMATPLMQ